jgi:hypothetical protein
MAMLDFYGLDSDPVSQLDLIASTRMLAAERRYRAVDDRVHIDVYTTSARLTLPRRASSSSLIHTLPVSRCNDDAIVATVRDSLCLHSPLVAPLSIQLASERDDTLHHPPVIAEVQRANWKR